MFKLEVLDLNDKEVAKKEYSSASLAVEAIAKAARYYTDRKEKVKLRLKDNEGRLIIATLSEELC